MAKKAKSLSEVPDEFLRCRAFRKHPETPVHDTVIRDGRSRVIGFIRREACPFCGGGSQTFYTRDQVSRRWTVIWRKREYPDFYQIEGGSDASELKDEFISRLNQHLDEEDPDEAAVMLDRKRRYNARQKAKREAAEKAPAKKVAAAKSTKSRKRA